MEYLVLGTLLILLKITIVSMATIHFTRDQLDTFIPLKACDATTNHVHNSMSCKCNSNTKTFIGYNCTHNIDACRIKQHKKRLSDEISSNDKVYVYNYVKGAPSWDEALGNAIKKVLVQGTRNHDQLEKLLEGHLLKIIDSFTSNCKILKFNGPGEFPLDIKSFSSSLHNLQSKSQTPKRTPITPTGATTNRMTTLMRQRDPISFEMATNKTGNYTRLINKGESDGFSTKTGVLIGTISALTLFLIVILAVFLMRQRKHNKLNRERVENPVEHSTPETSENPSGIDHTNVYSNATLPRYIDRLHSFSDSSFSTYTSVSGVEVRYNTPEADYSCSPYKEPDLTQPIYRELEPEQAYQNHAIEEDEYAVPEPEYKVLEPPEHTSQYNNQPGIYVNNETNNNTKHASITSQNTIPNKPSVPLKPLHLSTSPPQLTTTFNHHDNNLYDVTIDDDDDTVDIEGMYAQVQKS